MNSLPRNSSLVSLSLASRGAVLACTVAPSVFVEGVDDLDDSTTFRSTSSLVFNASLFSTIRTSSPSLPGLLSTISSQSLV